MKRNYKKIFLVVPEYSSFYPMMKQAFKELKIDHQIFDNRQTNKAEKVVVASSKFFPFLKDKHMSLINSRLLRSAKRYKPDLVIVIKGENVFPETVLKLKKIAPTINWFPDSLPNFKLAEDWLKSYNYIFIADNFIVSLYKKKGYRNIFHLPWAGMKITNIPEKKNFDVVFIGVHNPEREKVFLNLKDLNFKIWGSKQWGNSKLSDHYMDKWLSADESLEIIKRAKIIVNMHQNYDKKSTIMNLRVFETTSSKAMLITDYWSDMEQYYKIGKDFVIYKNGKDLKEKVQYYLTHEKERQKIAESGYKRANSSNRYEHRFRKMFSIISSNSKP